MPALPDVAGVVKVQLLATLSGWPYANVFHLDCSKGTGSFTSANLNAVTSGVRSAYLANLLTRQNPVFILGNVIATDLTSKTGAVSVSTGADPGSAAGTPYPNNVAMCISGHVVRRYRGGHPRFYFGGFNSPNQADSRHWATVWINNILTQWNAFTAAVKGITNGDFSVNNFCVVHYYSGGHLLATPTIDDITNWTIDARMDSQRRRLGKP